MDPTFCVGNRLTDGEVCLSVSIFHLRVNDLTTDSNICQNVTEINVSPLFSGEQNNDY
jgi:hypothetical protein